MRDVYTVDKGGYIDWSLYRSEPDDYKLIKNEVDSPIPKDQIFYRHRWNGKEWIEGGKPPEPSPSPEPQTDTTEQLLNIILGVN